MPMPDYYAILGVDPRASSDEIKRAFRRLTLEHHPDRHGNDPEVEERYRQINGAYGTLSDPARRARYDAQRRLGMLDVSKHHPGQTAKDLLGNMFGDVFGSRRAQRRRGRDLRYTLTVDLEEAVLGSTHTISFEAPGPCTTCRGSGARPGGAEPRACDVCNGKGELKGEGLFGQRTRCGRCDGTGLLQRDPCRDCRGRGTSRQMRSFDVRVPPGSEAGAERVLKGLGEPGRFDGESGDLRITVNVRPHPRLRREGDDIRAEVCISITEAARGTRLSVPTVDGEVELEIPAGIRSGTRLRLRNKGVPRGPSRARGQAQRGDQLVVVTVETPQLDADGKVAASLDQLEAVCVETGALPRRDNERARDSA